VAERQLLGDDAAAGETGHMRGGDIERAQHPGRVVGHRLDQERCFGHRRPARPAVVERSQAVAVGQPVELELPRLDRVPEAADQKHVGPVALCDSVQVGVSRGRLR
jgi:hypothetical protein